MWSFAAIFRCIFFITIWIVSTLQQQYNICLNTENLCLNKFKIDSASLKLMGVLLGLTDKFSSHYTSLSYPVLAYLLFHSKWLKTCSMSTQNIPDWWRLHLIKRFNPSPWSCCSENRLVEHWKHSSCAVGLPCSIHQCLKIISLVYQMPLVQLQSSQS